jgi:hypothetical protein
MQGKGAMPAGHPPVSRRLRQGPPSNNTIEGCVVKMNVLGAAASFLG